MTTTPRSTLLAAAALALLVLSGCAPTTSAPSDDGAAAGDPAAPSSLCPDVPQEGYDLFSSDLVLEAPEEGFVYKAGTPITWTLAVGPGYTPSMSISFINEAGDAIPEGDYNLLDNGDGSYSQDLGIFNSDAAGRPAYASVILVADGTFEPPAGQEDASQPVIGRYCITIG